MPTKEVRELRKKNGQCQSCGRDYDITVVRCGICKEGRRNKYRENDAAGLCTASGCNRLATDGKMCVEHRERMRERDRRKHKKLRDMVFAAYGGYRCACTGCTCKTPEFLQLDHINNDGGQHRREIGGCQQIGGGKMYYWLKKNNWPKIVQPMCANCNFAKGHYGSCPHEGKPH